jgi:CRISPR-associated protein Csm4
MGLEDVMPTVPADTLFSALVSAWRITGRDPVTFVAPFRQNPLKPPFLLTSAFPFVGEVRFYPAPVDLLDRFSKATVKRQGKTIKRIAWISESLLRAYLDGKPLDARLFPESPYDEPTGQQGVALQGGALWLTQQEASSLPDAMLKKIRKDGKLRLHALRRHHVWQVERVPRVTVDRVTDAANIFHAGRTTFARDCGLWFGVQWLRPDAQADDLAYQEAFELLLALLADSGLGGERTYGYGAFEYATHGPISLPDPQLHSQAMLLSRYHPRSEELPHVLQGAYRLESVAGWLESPDGADRRRKRLHLLAEGSLITWPGSPAGDVVDVNPTYQNLQGDLPHPVWRYGLALATAVKEASHA